MTADPRSAIALSGIPDDTLGSRSVHDWLLQSLAVLARTPKEALFAAPHSFLDLGSLVGDPDPHSGYLGNPRWRRALLALLCADWASYQTDADRVDVARLHYVFHAFPVGFRVWSVLLEHAWVPVGYTAWYPVSPHTFTLLEAPSDSLVDRGAILPCRGLPSPFLYLFNYSVTPQLIGSPLARDLVHRYAADITAQDPAGLGAITVSDHGVRVATRFGLTERFTAVIGGDPERVLAYRRKRDV